MQPHDKLLVLYGIGYRLHEKTDGHKGIPYLVRHSCDKRAHGRQPLYPLEHLIRPLDLLDHERVLNGHAGILRQSMEQTEIVGRIVSIPLSRAQECNTDHLTVALERQAYLSLRF